MSTATSSGKFSPDSSPTRHVLLSLLRGRTRRGQPDERRWEGSLLEPGQGFGLDLFPGNNVCRVGLVCGQPPLEFLFLRLGQQGRVRVGSDTIPDRLNQSETLLDAEPVDPKSFQGRRHNGSPVRLRSSLEDTSRPSPAKVEQV